MKLKIGYTIKNDAEVSWGVLSESGPVMPDEILDYAFKCVLGDKATLVLAELSSYQEEAQNLPKNFGQITKGDASEIEELSKNNPRPAHFGEGAYDYKGTVVWHKLSNKEKGALLLGTDVHYYLNNKLVVEIYDRMPVFYMDKDKAIAVLKKVADKFDAELVEEKA